jgi:hypothetical protein
MNKETKNKFKNIINKYIIRNVLVSTYTDSNNNNCYLYKKKFMGITINEFYNIK